MINSVPPTTPRLTPSLPSRQTPVPPTMGISYRVRISIVCTNYIWTVRRRHLPETLASIHPLNRPTSHVDTSGLEPHRSTPYSINSSSHSISLKSYNSRCSTGRASYRKHHSPPAREHTPTPEKRVPTFRSPSSYNLGMAESVGSGIPRPVVAPSSADDPNIPGEPIVPGHCFYPMSVNGAIRYENRNTR